MLNKKCVAFALFLLLSAAVLFVSGAKKSANYLACVSTCNQFTKKTCQGSAMSPYDNPKMRCKCKWQSSFFSGGKCTPNY
ncbi:hypothetical protein niasHT_017253 [Heterodera trifolii]|uniref:Uncharacterized protein n=1 Tax=Heterodera trifolii TaxID=157864 RepID=A0ABD2LGS1_9BILA